MFFKIITFDFSLIYSSTFFVSMVDRKDLVTIVVGRKILV